MQEDFKNQIQNAMGLWRKKGHLAMGHVIKNARDTIRDKLSEKGIAERWPALVNILDEYAPQLAPSFATLIGRKMNPLTDWLGLTIENWEPYKLELMVKPSTHLLGDDSWQTSSIVAMAEFAAKCLIEKHIPPGDLRLRTSQLELETFTRNLSNCTVRCELDPSEFEMMVGYLMKKHQTDYSMNVLILSPDNVLLSQTHFNFELTWTPLLK